MDLISRQKAKDVIDMALDSIDHVPSWVYDKLLNALNEVPSVQPTQLTNEDKETIRIHLNAFKESLCNQGRWYEATEYEELIHRVLSTPSVQPEIIRCKDCKHWNNAPATDGYNSCEKDALIRHESFFCADAKLRGEQDG